MNRRTAPAAPEMATTPHTVWCAGGHRCNLGEHRSVPLLVDGDQARGVLTRVRDNYAEYAEIRIRVALSTDPWTARVQLHNLLSDVRDLVDAAGHVSVTGTAPVDGWAA